ncbi:MULTISPECIES: N-acetylglucosamine-6-phosphate deacetylase [unclassified Shinella]|uniref:N-acetylglucosamine-6-phosphate deacetylase n=1 Tax=unclassified Shinella TaxID=2643062 RepID=UPI00225DA7BE|nr:MULTISPECIES: N-acetylglucosamine-6-phosphate deacetylase [unclassified Shinella]MCO5138674.1 N-acetylglucosamine-6-phosphate deacetylase [Shinella sp.]MDC7255512.1 N-acetylglucosamine-6-phosphate deacetylase [Shinella sp. YE25]CAI0338306.1 N-acetylglucosamine-6-phosphate deacetylase [Rhizobiaceae bacterium]CAK7256755.1 N-acetylglucosamine-6-phosphate deacetylase [Shinella sp. WSC3-e]
MTALTALTGARIFDGDLWHEDSALLIADGKVAAIAPLRDVPADARAVPMDGLSLVPGFIDLQVNGGGGVLLNERPDLEGIRTICAAHARFGTTALLPTLITDNVQVTTETIAAGLAAQQAKVPGFLGLHLEGPHLSVARKGAHDPNLIRPMEDDDLARTVAARKGLDALLMTLAPENATNDQIAALHAAGVTVSLGHSDCSYRTAAAAVEAGAGMMTHLFNAMSPLGHREPGMVGAALDLGHLNAGLIADGFHVDPASIGVALRAKRGPGRIFLVTDAMSTIGTDMTSFFLNGREIFREGGRLTLADGTLAGADIDMASCIRFMRDHVGLDLEEALRMASLYPAEAIGMTGRKGRLTHGHDADIAVIDGNIDVLSTWIAGTPVFAA